MITQHDQVRGAGPICALAVLLGAALGGCPNVASFLAGFGVGNALTPPPAEQPQEQREEPPPPADYTLKPNVRLLNTIAPSARFDVSDDSITIAGLPSSVSLQPGDVIVLTTGEGFLGKAIAVTQGAEDQVIVRTEPASLEEVFSEAHLSASAPLELVLEEPVEGRRAKESASRTIRFNTPLGIHPVIEVGPRITIDTGLTYHCDVDYGFLGLENVECYVEGSLTVDALMALTVGGGVHAKAEKPLIPTAVVGGFSLGPIPVTVNYDLTAGGKFNIDYAGTVSQGASIDVAVRAGVGWNEDRGIYAIGDHQIQVERHDLEWMIGGRPSFDLFLGNKFSIKAVGMAGPFVRLKSPSLKTSYESGVVTVAPGVSGQVGGELTLFSLRLAGVEVELFDVRLAKWEWTVHEPLIADAGADQAVASGDCATLNGGATGGDGNYTFSWFPETGLSDPRSAVTTAWPANTVTYTLTVTDGTGASATDSVVVSVGPDVGDVTLVGGSGNFTTTSGDFDIAVTPRDSQGNFIGNDLPQSAFSFQNVVLDPEAGGPDVQVSATVTGIEVEEPSPGEAVTAVLVFDSSGSMSANDPGAVGRRAGAIAFFDAMTGDDEVAIIDFGPSPSGGLEHSRLLQDFTNDRTLLEAALDQLTQLDGTPLYGALVDALGLLEQRLGGPGGVIVVLTDGEAGDDELFGDVVAQALGQGVAIYPIGLGENIDFGQLRDLAQQTGGTFAEAADADAMRAVFEGIGLGVTVGKVTVFGHCTYSHADPGRYTVRGELVTQSGTTNIVTPFSFTADVAP